MDNFDTFEDNSFGNKPSYGNNNHGGGQQSGFKKGFNRFKPKEPEGPAELYLPFTVALNPDFPAELRSDLRGILKRFDEQNFTMRTGGNSGEESDIESCVKRLEIHLPWRGFNDKESKFTFNSTHAFEIAKMFSPNFDKMKDSVKAMFARNVRMMLGKDLKSPTMALVTWTPDGASSAAERTPKTGFSGQHIAMASAMRVPVFNLAKPNTLDAIQKYL